MSKQPKPPANRGGRRGTVTAIAEKRAKDLAEGIQVEDAQRRLIVNSFTAERDAMFLVYDEESRKLKDWLINVLEKRLHALKTTSAVAVAEAEGTLENILSGTSKLLLECHRAGLLIVQKLDQGSTISATVTPSLSRVQSNVNQRVASPRNTPPPQASPSQAATSAEPSSTFEGSSRVLSVLQDGGAGHADFVEREERILRFFNSDLPENRLNARAGRDICRRLEEMAVALTGLLDKSLVKLRTSHARVTHLEQALRDEVMQRVSCEKMLSGFLVRGQSEADRVVERCRELLSGFEFRMQKIEKDARLELQGYIRQGAEAALARAKIPDDPFSIFKFESNAIMDGFLTTLEKTRALHQGLLRDIELRMTDFSSEPIRNASNTEVGKLFRSGLPADCRRILQSEELFDRASLLRLVDHLSFEPRSCEVTAALLREFQSFLDQNPEQASSLVHMSAGTQSAGPQPPLPHTTPLLQPSAAPVAVPAGLRTVAGGSGGVPAATSAASSSAFAPVLQSAMAVVPAAHIAPPLGAHLICVDSTAHSLVPTNLILTPFNKFWIEKMNAEEKGRAARLEKATVLTVSEQELVLPPTTTTAERRALFLQHLAVREDGKPAEAPRVEECTEPSTTSKATPLKASAASGAFHKTAVVVSLAATPSKRGKPSSAQPVKHVAPESRAPVAPDSMSALAKAFSVKQRQLIEQLSSQ